MTKKVKSKVLEIIALALEFNGRSTKCECTGSKPTIFAVSYTHLDVYKRQVRLIFFCSLWSK